MDSHSFSFKLKEKKLEIMEEYQYAVESENSARATYLRGKLRMIDDILSLLNDTGVK